MLTPCKKVFVETSQCLFIYGRLESYDLPLTWSTTTLLLTGFVLMVHRYSPWSSHLMSRICRFHSLMYGRTTLNLKSSTTRRSSYVNGIDLWSSHATCVCSSHNPLAIFFRGLDISSQSVRIFYNETEAYFCGLRYKKYSCSTLYLPRYSIEHGRTAVCPATTVTFTIGTSNAGSKPETANISAELIHVIRNIQMF